MVRNYDALNYDDGYYAVETLPPPPPPYYCDVDQYGAVGDGSTDDTGAIYAALAAGVARLGPKTYRVSGITIKSTERLKGISSTASKLLRYSNEPVLTIDTSGGDIYNLDLDGFALENDDAGSNSSGLLVTGANYLRRSRIHDLNVQGPYSGIRVDAPMDWTEVSGCIVQNSGAFAPFYPIYVTKGGTGNIWANNRIIVGRQDAGATGMYFSASAIGDVVIVGNHIDGGGPNTYGIQVIGQAPYTYIARFVITGNKIDGAGHPIKLDHVSDSTAALNRYTGGVAVPVEDINGQNNVIDTDYGNGIRFPGKVSFFGSPPTARPTGVPVTPAGIHAALVTLGLITP